MSAMKSAIQSSTPAVGCVGADVVARIVLHQLIVILNPCSDISLAAGETRGE